MAKKWKRRKFGFKGSAPEYNPKPAIVKETKPSTPRPQILKEILKELDPDATALGVSLGKDSKGSYLDLILPKRLYLKSVSIKTLSKLASVFYLIAAIRADNKVAKNEKN